MSLIRVGGKVMLGAPTRVMSFSCCPDVLVLDKHIISHVSLSCVITYSMSCAFTALGSDCFYFVIVWDCLSCCI